MGHMITQIISRIDFSLYLDGSTVKDCILTQRFNSFSLLVDLHSLLTLQSLFDISSTNFASSHLRSKTKTLKILLLSTQYHIWQYGRAQFVRTLVFNVQFLIRFKVHFKSRQQSIPDFNFTWQNRVTLELFFFNFVQFFY